MLWKALHKNNTLSKTEQIYQHYKSSMFRMAYAILHNTAAEDAVHDALVKIMANEDKIEDITSAKTKAYIILILKNTAIDQYRKNKRQSTIMLEGMENECALEKPSLEDAVISEEGYQHLLQRMKALDAKYKDILYCLYIYDYTQEETAALLGISANTLRVRLHRAKKMLLEQEEVIADGQTAKRQNFR